ncbi:MAG TPA: MYG1 family protein [Candidatus Paceibacterota bacterium]|nr:MYG1 family protein [Candidatus Paceibacterota bacterium]
MEFTMDTKNKTIIAVTHDGSFHSDDIFATATLSLLFEMRGENFELTRTRDEVLINGADYVYDVGGVYDEEKNHFDHHQKGGAGKRENGIEYASFGLVWKKFGAEVAGSQLIADIIDERLASPIDAHDNGQDLVESKFDVSPYIVQNIFGAMMPTWKEEDKTYDEMFTKCIPLAKEILRREITIAKDALDAEEIVKNIYKNTKDKRIIELDKRYPYEYVLKDLSEPLFVIYPRTDGLFGVKAIRESSTSFKNRKDFPSAWAGKRDAELADITGVPDAVFCHRALFLAVAGSAVGARRLAELALK